MPTVIERLNASVSTGGLEHQLTSQVGALQQAIALAGPLIEGRTPDIGTLIARLGALRGPAFDGGGSFAAALQQAETLVPSDLDALVAPLGGRFAEMATLVDERLKPLLQDAVRAAQAIQQLLNVRLGCLDGVAGSNVSTAPPPPPAPGSPAPPGRAAVAAQQVAAFESVLGGLPPTIDAGVLLQLLLMLLGSKPRDRFFVMNLPVVDDLINPLQTLAGWAILDEAGVAAQMAATIDLLTTRVREAAALPLADLGTLLTATAPQWRRPALSASTDTIANGLTALETALRTADDAAAAVALGTLNPALDQYDALRAAMNADVLPAVPALRDRVALSPLAWHDSLTHLLVLLEPSNVASRVTSLIPSVQPVPPDAIEAVRGAIQPIIDWLQDLIALLDFGAAQDGVAEVATEARAIATGLESGLTEVTLQVQSAFAGVGETVSGIGLDDLRDELSGQIVLFGEQIRRDITQAFAPAREGTHAAIGAVSDALEAFDPAAIVDALQQVVDGIAGVLNGPDVTEAIATVRLAVDSVVDALRALSFQPVTDEVVALIGNMKNGLQAIIETDLNDATRSALAGAMSVLPDDLRPVTAPLVEDFGELVDTGPLALLSSVKDAPRRLLDEIERFEPAALIGDRLSAPYRALLDRADQFEASTLFAGADAELERARRRLLQTARPGRALEPLREPVQQLLARLDEFSATALLAPLTQRVEETIAQIVDASPVDEILAAINGVFDAVREVLTLAERIQSVAARIGQLFDALANADAQLDAWRDGLLANVPSAANAQLQASLAALTSAVDGTRHTEVLAAFDAAAAPALAELDALDPAARLTRIVTAYGRVASQVAAMPASATKTAVQLLMARFNPAQPAHSAPLRLAADLRSALGSSRADLVSLASEWTGVVDGLSGLRNVGADALGDLLSAAIEPVLQPVRFVFRSAGALAAPVNGMAQTLTQLVTTLTERVDALVNGPESLSAISGAVQQVVDVLRQIDLDFVGRSLDDVLQTVRDQLRALDPARLADELDAAFEQALSGVSLSAVVPPEDIAALDAAWQAVVDDLRQLDPGRLVEDIVQPIYDAAVLPLLDAFDLTPVFDALIEFLESLKGELGTGLEAVNSAYQSLIALRPDGGASASIGA